MATMIQTNSSDTLTAVRVIIDAASLNVVGAAGVLNSGAAEYEWPRSVAGAFPRSEWQRADVDRPRLHSGIQRPARLAFAQVRGVFLGIFGVALTGVVHTDSTNDSSSVLSRFRARNNLFFTVPNGSFFIDAISSYDSSAKWRSWIKSR